MIDTASPSPDSVPHKVLPIGCIVDGIQILIGVPEDQITSQDDIDAVVKKMQKWLMDLHERAEGFEARMNAIGALLRPGQVADIPTAPPAAPAPVIAPPA